MLYYDEEMFYYDENILCMCRKFYVYLKYLCNVFMYS